MNTKTTGLLAIALIVIVGVGIFTFAGSGKKEVKTMPTPKPESVMVKESYKDGEYSQVGTYTSPAGPEEIDVKLSLKEGVVTEVEVTPKAVHAISKAKQEAFAGGYKEMVVGKSIKDLQLTKVAGSSLTPKGFNDAVAKIKAEARS